MATYAKWLQSTGGLFTHNKLYLLGSDGFIQNDSGSTYYLGFEKTPLNWEYIEDPQDIKKTPEELYMFFQERQGLRVGDRVKVMRKAESHAKGWRNSWTQVMTNCIGGTYTVRRINSRHGIGLVDVNQAFPCFVLKKVKST